MTDTVDVGGNLAAIVSEGNSIWVGDRDGKVLRLDPLHPAAAPTTISTGGAVVSLAAVDGKVWLAAHASSASHRGGTLRIAQFRPDHLPRYQMDPHANPFYNVSSLEADGLVGYRHIGGAPGAEVLANLATSVPRPTNNGLTYTFQLRPDLEYADGRPVLASDFQRAIERTFQVSNFFRIAWGGAMFYAVEGSQDCTTPTLAPVEQCDLSRGIEADDVAGTVQFNLSTPDPEFVYRLTNPVAYPVPDGVPMHEWVDGAFPGTGPYVVSAVTDNEVRLGRNQNFRLWDASVRPDGYPDEIVFTVVDSDEQRISMIENNEADYTSYRGLTRSSHELFAPIKTRYPVQWHSGSTNTGYIAMNASVSPFNDIDVRRALNFAVDRGHLADLFGGQPDAPVTCQFLPPVIPGYKPVCPYTVDPDEAGRWKGSDMQTAQELVERSGTAGTTVLIGPTFPHFNESLDYVATVLGDLGYETVVSKVQVFEELFDFNQRLAEGLEERHITITGWSPDYVAPSNYLQLLKCDADIEIAFCDPTFDAAFNHALQLQATDPAGAWTEWAALDQRATELAITVPLYNAGGDFVSERVGNYQYNPSDVVLFDQMWVQ